VRGALHEIVDPEITMQGIKLRIVGDLLRFGTCCPERNITFKHAIIFQVNMSLGDFVNLAV
jgi:hypothetical protein